MVKNMTSMHGSLENEIMNAVWSLEEKADVLNGVNISVGDIVDFINSYGSHKAYTTIKTVMDRLVDKHYLIPIKNLVGQYVNNDIRSLIKVLEKECLKI